MNRSRSPHYPSIGLSQAIDSVKALWDREGRTAVAPEAAVRAWGYTSLSGPARSRIAALRQYGLLDTGGEEGVRVSELALEIVQHPDGSEEKRTAVARAALNPELFRELSKTHAQASDDSLKAYLVTKRQFTEDGAKQFIRAFRDAMGLVKLSESDYAPPRDRSKGESEDMVGDVEQKRKDLGIRVVSGFSIPVSGGLVAEVKFTGDADLTPEDVDMLADYLRLVRQAIARSGARAASTGEVQGTSAQGDGGESRGKSDG
jgi:hypothetical protein